MASGSEKYGGINAGRAARAGKGKPSAAKQRQNKVAKKAIDASYKKNGGKIF